jgi:hypothetical protein
LDVEFAKVIAPINGRVSRANVTIADCRIMRLGNHNA